MNNVDYLNQISSNSKPQAPTNDSLLDNKIFRIVAISAAALTIVFLLLSIFRNIGNQSRSRLEQLYLRTDSLTSATTEYNSSLKSPELRSAAVSFAATLKSLSANLADIYKDNNISNKNSSTKNTNLETENSESMTTTLESGRLNGILDRTYAHEMSYQISTFITIIENAKNITKDSDVIETLNNAQASLRQLHSVFDNFSDAQN